MCLRLGLGDAWSRHVLFRQSATVMEPPRRLPTDQWRRERRRPLPAAPAEEAEGRRRADDGTSSTTTGGGAPEVVELRYDYRTTSADRPTATRTQTVRLDRLVSLEGGDGQWSEGRDTMGSRQSWKERYVVEEY